jgi:hypothetical protein
MYERALYEMARAECNAKGQKSRKSSRFLRVFFLELPAEPVGLAPPQPQQSPGLML